MSLFFRANKITMVANGDGEVGAARMADEVISIMTKVPDMVNNMTGIDLSKQLAI